MEHLFPAGRGPGPTVDAADIARTVLTEARRPQAGRPWVMLNMVSSVDGATAVDGTSGALGGEADKAMFTAIRSLADLIVVAATTASEEDYQPPTLPMELQGDRKSRNQAPLPRLAVVSNSLTIEPSSSALFTDDHRPLVITSPASPSGQRRLLERHTDVLVTGGDRVDLSAALAELAGSGVETVLLEGGPSLNGQFVADDLVDEMLLTLAPTLAAGASSRLAVADTSRIIGLTLSSVLHHQGFLFLRYLRSDRG